MANSARIDELRKKFDENPRRYFAPLANEYRKIGDLDQAIFICQEYLPQQPGHMSGHIVYGQALYEAGRMDEARTVFETALTLDPENLIALRHLGDIAKSASDAPTARKWYLRVLEVDPRNEEIAALLAGLGPDTPAPSAVPETSPPPVPVEAEASADSPLALETSPESVELTEPPPIPVEGAHPEVVASDELLELTGDDASFTIPSAPEPAHEEPPPIPVAASASDDSLLDLDELPGAPAESNQPAEGWVSGSSRTDIDADASPPNAPLLADFTPGSETPASETADDVPSSFEPMEFETTALDGQDTRAASTPASSAEVIDSAVAGLELSSGGSWPAAPETESHAHGDELEEFTLPESSPSSVEASEPTPEAPVVEEFSVEEPVPAAAPEPMVAEATPAAPEPAIEEEFEIAAEATAEEPEATHAPIVDAEPTPPPAVTDRPDATTPAAPANLFVTETMAELYLEQGHLESALEIYKHLLEQRPADESLRARRHAIEQQLYGAPEPIDEPLAAPQAQGDRPTIRDFLTGLLTQRPSAVAVDDAAGAPAPATEAPASQAAVADESPAASAAEAVAPARPTPASPSDTVSGSIDSLFGGVDASASDVAAASALADAFAAEAPEAPLLTGMPAHRASSELSLDHVFRANAPQPEPENGAGFSFDQFFAEEITEPKAPAASDPAANTGASPDDIAQFNAWLSGLKKT